MIVKFISPHTQIKCHSIVLHESEFSQLQVKVENLIQLVGRSPKNTKDFHKNMRFIIIKKLLMNYKSLVYHATYYGHICEEDKAKETMIFEIIQLLSSSRFITKYWLIKIVSEEKIKAWKTSDYSKHTPMGKISKSNI